MHRSSAKGLSALIVSVGTVLAAISAVATAGTPAKANTPSFKISSRHGKSHALRDYKMQGPQRPMANHAVPNERELPKQSTDHGVTDSVVQKKFGISQPSALLQFDGQSDDDNAELFGFRIVPPDTNGDVSNDHYIQFINLIFAIYDKSGDPDSLVAGPFPGNVLWEGFGGPCEAQNDGDPVVKYDRLANRWVFTQFALPNYPDGPSFQCFAVSQTSDPLGDYNLYEFTIGSLATGWGDYPKLGIWPDAYYIAFNMFTAFSFEGMGAYAFNRDAMLAGDEAGAISFQPFDGGGLPSDLDGSNPPPEGSPNYFMTWWNNSPGTLNIYQFHVDWETPDNSTLTGPVAIPTADWIVPCGFDPCVPQLDSDELLDTLSDRLMNRLAYRNFGDHESLVSNFTVGTENGETAVRWFEIRNPGGGTNRPEGVNGPFVYQEGTYNPDSNFRWMASIAQDRQGNMGLGYSISSSEMFPSIAVTGRLVNDPPGTMGAEDIFFAGTGSQVNSVNRWGDYSSMSVDPSDDCTFWFTQEYYANTEPFDFKTRIGSFKFPNCTAGPTGTLEGTVTDGTDPIGGASVTAGENHTTTNAAGHYQLILPVGTYDMTVTKYGFFPGSAAGVEVTEGNTTTQDFTLEGAPARVVNGTVRDLATGWPLYAKIQITAPGFGGEIVWTDAVTGYYSTILFEGATYQFRITPVAPGYLPGGGQFSLGEPLANAPFVVKNWTVEANAETCNAPGYTFIADGLYEQFNSGNLPALWSIENHSEDDGPPWKIFEGADPCGAFAGNETGGSGPYALINSNCDGFLATAVTDLITPSVDLSGVSNPVIQFKSDFSILDPDVPQTGTVDYSTDGGANWTNLLELDTNQPGPSTKQAALPSAADVKVRFHYDAFWAWWWQVDNVLVGAGTCQAPTGGLVVGNVKDAATGLGLNGASVINVNDGSTTTFQDPQPGQPAGFYFIYAEAGSNFFDAKKRNYATGDGVALVVPGSTQRLDFSLLSGNLSFSPSALNARVNPGGTDSQEAAVTNTGAAAAGFELVEINAPLLHSETHGFANESLRQRAIARLPQGSKGPDHVARSARGLAPLTGLSRGLDRLLAAGKVLSSFDSGLVAGWGVATSGSDVWITNPSYISYGAGDDLDHSFHADGTPGATMDDTGIGLWAGDGAFDTRNKTIWRVAVGGDNCLYELDPATHAQTGNTICGSWTGVSQRGVAYDEGNDAFFVGGWNELTVYHIDRSGDVLDSAFVDLAISGLAYAPDTGHLLVMSNQPAGNDVTVLDALNNYAVLGAFQVLDNGSPAFGDFQQAGMELDCAGNLWAINQVTQVAYRIESGEAASCEISIPWFSVNPSIGVVPPSAIRGATINSAPVTASWDAGNLLPGLRQAQLVVKTDTPYAVPPVPVTLTVRFLDVPEDNIFQAFIYAAAGAGVMMGGPPNCPAGILDFCPNGVVTRADMAGYLWRAINGRNTPPPVYQNVFTDVTFNDYNSFYIQGIYDMGITAGCAVGLYCPNDPNTRQQMAVFIWKGQHGTEPPPPCTAIFNDVPCSSPFAPYIEGIYNEGVTVGCGGGNFCPTANITNGQMATFLVKGFNIPVLLP